MKRHFLLFLVALLPMVALTTFTSCGSDDDDDTIVNPNTGNNNGGNNNNNQQDREIVVTVDANGNANAGHSFSRIDETTFYIDGLKYKYENGNLTVIGYDPVFFTGTATVISKLIYNGGAINVVSIGNEAFYGCKNLTSVFIGNGVTRIGKDAFMNCTSLTSITIPESVTGIGNYAFRGCSNLTSITIPESVTSIGNYAFSGCSSLTSIKVEDGNPKYDSRDNCNALIKTATNTLIRGCNNTTIPNSVTSIGDVAFYDCRSLTSITIPNSVTSIGTSAFYYCSSLTTLIIGNGLTGIGLGAFYECTSLTDVYCYAENVPGTISSFDESSVSSATLHVPAGSVDAYKAADPWNQFGTIVAIE